MKLFVTGGTGFVGSNVLKVAAERHGASVVTTSHSYQGDGTEPFEVVPVDMTDGPRLRGAVMEAKPDAIVHAAILADFNLMYADRRLAWKSYVESTETLVDVANEVEAKMVMVSTDWVFDGAQPGATELTPPNPINLYGVLKVVGETVVGRSANNGAVARVAGVNGTHWLRDDFVASQNPGLGHFVGAVVRSLRAGEPFPVWTGPLNMVGTPALASESAEMIMRIIEKDRRGIFHCTGASTVDRMGLAIATAAAFDLDADLISTGPGDFSGTGPAPIPIDTSLDATATGEALDYELPDLDRLLEIFRHEVDHNELAPV
jgi:dTDP-4-dehydrorhamnose reductase